MRSRMRSLLIGLGLGILSLGFSGCTLTELRNTNRRLKEANDRLVSENNRLEQELTMAERDLVERNREITELTDRLAKGPQVPETPQPAVRPEKRNAFEDLGLETARTSQGTLVYLDQQVFFPLGKASLSGEGKRILARVANLLNTTYRTNIIRVEGHTDNIPVVKVRHLYPTNWELSTARACAVVRHLVQRGNLSPHRIYPAGFSFYKPRVANSTAVARSKNRRVEVLILNDSSA